VDLAGDAGVVGCAGEDRSLLEEAHRADVAVEIVGEHRHHAGDQRGTQQGRLLGERVLHGHGRGRTALGILAGIGTGGCVEEIAVGLRGEGAGDGLGVAEGKQAGADGGLSSGGGLGDDDARRR
jgi:hypothetical protein